jgi:hypothetical protein
VRKISQIICKTLISIFAIMRLNILSYSKIKICFIVLASQLLLQSINIQADTIWIDAKDYSQKTPHFAIINFGEPGIDSSSGKVAQLHTDAITAHRIVYSFSIAATGQHKIWAAVTPPNSEWASPYSILLKKQDGNATETVDAESIKLKNGKAYGDERLPNLFQWFLLLDTKLEEGAYELAFEVSKPRKLDGQTWLAMNFLLDAIFITSEDERPNGPRKPGL